MSPRALGSVSEPSLPRPHGPGCGEASSARAASRRDGPRQRLVSVVLPWHGAPPPLTALRALAGRRNPFLRHAAGGPRDLARWSFAGADPVEVLAVGGTRRGLDADPWRALARRVPRPVRRVGARIPFAGGWFGTFGYELRAAVERVPPPRAPADGFRALWLGRYDAVVAWDRHARRAYVAGTGPTLAAARATARRLRDLVAAGSRAEPTPARPAPAAAAAAPRVRPTVPASAYRRRVAAVRARIRAGDLFQANLSQRFEGPLVGTTLALFERLAARSPVPFLSYVDVGGGRAVLSASPERFVSLVGDRAETRPMKGTRPRGADAAADRRLRDDLAKSEKDRAELAMIVDLARNDLGRSCAPGTVRVVRPRRLERYATVHQAVGVVEGRLAPGRTGIDLVREAFPPGSVTGAPKVEAMKRIDALEAQARGPYCGAVGWIDEGGDLDLAVAIRTLTVAGGRVAYRVGGGVTLLSDPEAERVETLDKGRALARAVEGDGAGPGAPAAGRRRRRA
ncbi:MAG: anthranilate synthase component I family protein [Planctomycetes bacterium]|nr:anthranilate synthase component I family protein [Planctomycetota bacterium]